MESYCTNSYLEDKGIIQESQVFFIQRSMELLHNFTLDTYSIRATNSHFILCELMGVISLLEAGIIKEGNLKPLTEECLELVGNDIVLDDHAKQLKNTLLPYLTKLRNNNLATIKYHLSWAVKHLQKNYLNWCISSLENALASSNLERIQSVTSILVTELVQLGWTTEGLRGLIQTLIRDSKRQTFDRSFSEFLVSITQPKKSFLCLVKIPNVESAELNTSIQSAGYTVMNYESINDQFDIPSLGHKLSRSNFYALINVNAYETKGAVRQGFEIILHIINMMSFYEFDIKPFYQGVTILVLDDSKTRMLASHTQYPRLYQKRTGLSSTLFESTQNVLRREKENYDVNERFQGLFLYSRLAEDSLLPEGSFLNYWVALESFAKVDDGKVIEQLEKVVPAVLSNRYIYRLLRNFYEDCKRCSIDLESINAVFAGNSLSLIARELLKLIKDPHSTQLKDLCSNHTLLLYRYQTLEEALSCSKNILKLIKSHYRNVQWHLARLYRVRNEIAHSGTSPNNLEQLLSNLKTYVRQTVQETLIKLDKTPNSTIPEILALICDSYDCTEKLLSDSKFTCDEVFLLDGPFHNST